MLVIKELVAGNNSPGHVLGRLSAPVSTRDGMLEAYRIPCHKSAPTPLLCRMQKMGSLPYLPIHIRRANRACGIYNVQGNSLTSGRGGQLKIFGDVTGRVEGVQCR